MSISKGWVGAVNDVIKERSPGNRGDMLWESVASESFGDVLDNEKYRDLDVAGSAYGGRGFGPCIVIRLAEP